MFNNYYYNPYYNNYPRNHHFYPNYSNNYNSYSYSPYYNYYYNQGYYPRSNESNNRYYLGQNGIEERKLNDNDYNYERYNNRFNRHYNNNKEEEKTSNKKSENDLILDYENNIRKEIEKTTPLISDELSINKLMEEYKSNEEYLKSIENISKKYKTYKKVRRDGNCFYRSFIYRLFEQTCIKNDKNLYEKIINKIKESKNLTEKNGYEWAVVQDFYEIFLKEFTECFNCLSSGIIPRDYLDKLFSDKDKGNYLIYFIRFCIAAFLKENKDNYKSYIEEDFEKWIRKEVEAIDHVADQIQIMACVNYFDVGVKIEYLNKFKDEVVKLPENKPDEEFFIYLLFSPGHYDILYP